MSWFVETGPGNADKHEELEEKTESSGCIKQKQKAKEAAKATNTQTEVNWGTWSSCMKRTLDCRFGEDWRIIRPGADEERNQ